MGVTLYPEVLQSQGVDVQVGESFGGGWSQAGWVPGGGDLYWPVLLIYQQFQQTDFLRQVPPPLVPRRISAPLRASENFFTRATRRHRRVMKTPVRLRGDQERRIRTNPPAAALRGRAALAGSSGARSARGALTRRRAARSVRRTRRCGSTSSRSWTRSSLRRRGTARAPTRPTPSQCTTSPSRFRCGRAGSSAGSRTRA